MVIQLKIKSDTNRSSKEPAVKKRDVTVYKKMFRYSFFILSLSLLSSCNDFLSQPPDNRTSIDTKEKISELLVSAYPEANYMTFCEAMTDNVSEHLGGYSDNTNTDPYFFKDASQTEQDSPEYYWNACYAAIAAANQALKVISEAENASELDAQKGEALVARAYSHLMLVSLFAKWYDEETADKDPGIPYVKVPETVALKQYERHTVQYVYDQIEKDLKAGIPLINDEAYDIPAYHFTRAAANALAVRFYLNQKNYTKVIEHANQVFPDNDLGSRLRPWNTIYQNYTFDQLEAAYTKSTEPANLLLVETSSLWARTYTRFRYSTGTDELDDIRSIAAVARGDFAYTVYFNSGSNIYFVVKFREHFVKENISDNTGLPYTIIPALTVEEVLLSRAEAYTYLGQNTNAIKDLNSFYSTRIQDYDPTQNLITVARLQSYYGTTNTFGALLNTIVLCRRAEFLHEGLWWFDILRYGFPVTHFATEGVFELDEDDPRRVLQIPREAISLAGLPANPR